MIWRSPSIAHVDDRAQRAADQALDLLGAARRLARRRLAVDALGRRAGQHRVLGGDPALALAAHPTAARRSSIDAVHSTRVAPNDTSTDPAAASVKSRSKVIGRSSSGCRPSCLTPRTSYVIPLVDRARLRPDRRSPPRPPAARASGRSGHQVGQDQMPHAALGAPSMPAWRAEQCCPPPSSRSERRLAQREVESEASGSSAPATTPARCRPSSRACVRRPRFAHRASPRDGRSARTEVEIADLVVRAVADRLPVRNVGADAIRADDVELGLRLGRAERA